MANVAFSLLLRHPLFTTSGENGHKNRTLWDYFEKEWHAVKFSFLSWVSGEFLNSPGWTLSCLPLAIPTRTERLFPVYIVWFSERPLYHLPANTPGKKTVLTQFQYCFLVKTWYPKKGKRMNKTSRRTTTINYFFEISTRWERKTAGQL